MRHIVFARLCVALSALAVVSFVLLPVAGAGTIVGSPGGVYTSSGGGGGSGTVSGTAGQVGYFDAADSITSEATGFAWDATNNRLGIGDDTPDAVFECVAGTLTDGIPVTLQSATMPATIATTMYANAWTVTSAGSSAQTNGGLQVSYAAGYTGNSSTVGARFANAAAGTGTSVVGAAANYGIIGVSTASTTGTNIGSLSAVTNATALGVGSIGRSLGGGGSSTAVAVLGTASGGNVNVGGWFTLDTSNTPSWDTAALVADNAAAASPIFLAKDNSSTVFSIADGGSVTISSTTTNGSCTLNAGSPSTCTATVTSGSKCVCSNVGTTAPVAANGCAVSLSGTTLTITSANAANNVVNYHCF